MIANKKYIVSCDGEEPRCIFAGTEDDAINTYIKDVLINDNIFRCALYGADDVNQFDFSADTHMPNYQKAIGKADFYWDYFVRERATKILEREDWIDLYMKCYQDDNIDRDLESLQEKYHFPCEMVEKIALNVGKRFGGVIAAEDNIVKF